MTCMRARMSSILGLIGPPTVELAALERLKKSPYTYIGEKLVLPLFSQLLLIKSFSYLQVMMTYIRACMSSKFGQIRSWTTELAALEHRPFSRFTVVVITGKKSGERLRAIGPLV